MRNKQQHHENQQALAFGLGLAFFVFVLIGLISLLVSPKTSVIDCSSVFSQVLFIKSLLTVGVLEMLSTLVALMFKSPLDATNAPSLLRTRSARAPCPSRSIFIFCAAHNNPPLLHVLQD